MGESNKNIGFVAIGRNEGERLKRCLLSIAQVTDRVVYVDSNSSDGSVTFARERNVEVVELDMSIPFTAARARDAGFERLKEKWPDTDFVHFIDGDCEVVEGWPEKALAEIMRDDNLGVVTGWRSERFPDATVYNMMCEVEWRGPAGDIAACGGDMLVRVAAYEEAGGFNPIVIAAEDDEFCIRVRKAGYAIRRLTEEMTLHDAAMTRFSEWWARARRAGHGYAQVGAMHPDYFRQERRRVILWGAVIPALAIIALLIRPWLIIPFIALYGLSYLKSRRGLIAGGVSPENASAYGRFLVLSKAPNFLGMMTYWRRRLLNDDYKIIEYK
ncbi:MAG: glycosyltransferase [Pseudomonadota bacterium]